MFSHSGLMLIYHVHRGPKLIKSDPNFQNYNGKLFEQFLDGNSNLIVANNLNLCQRKIPRIRNLNNKNAILDFLIVNEKTSSAGSATLGDTS